MVDYYGSPTPVQQVCIRGCFRSPHPDHHPWDGTLIKAISKAIQTSDIGINPIDDGHTIRLVFPAPTEERRKQLDQGCAEAGRRSQDRCAQWSRRDAMDKFKARKRLAS